ncbi:MAG: flagellar motor switch protein FliG [Thermodesulfobacteriota bacterium]
MAENLSGTQKIAVLLLALGESYATQAFQEMEQQEIVQVSKAMAELDSVPQETVESVLQEFTSSYNYGQKTLFGGPTQMRKILSKSLDQEVADSVINSLEYDFGPAPFKGLEKFSPNLMAQLLSNEHPQTLALVIGHLSPGNAAEVVQKLPSAVRAEVLMRLARLESVPLDMLYEVDKVLQDQLKAMGGEGQKVGGVQSVAEILNAVDRSTEEEVLSDIEEESAQMAEDIRELMFVFEDIRDIDDRAVRELLKEISNDDLTLALKGASEDLQQKFFKNLSERAAGMIQEDLEIMGPVRLSDVENAQRSIVREVRRLEAEGRIVLAGKGGEDVLV